MNILAIGSHPDDVEIGCGGAISLFSEAGHQVFYLIMTHGEVGGKASKRTAEQKAAAKILGVKKIYWGGYKDTQISKDQTVIKAIEKVVNKVNPDLVLVHGPADTHQDHRYVNACALSATRHIKRILYYEVPTSNDFHPNIFVDIEKSFKKKLQALEAHASQMTRTNIPQLPIQRLAEAMANFRGTQCKVKFAEGFHSPRLLLTIGKNKENLL